MSFYKNSHFTSSYPDKFESFGKFRVLWLYRTKEARTVFASSSHGLSLKLFALRRYVTLHYVTLRYVTYACATIVCKSRALFMIEHEIVRTRPTPSHRLGLFNTQLRVSHDSVLGSCILIEIEKHRVHSGQVRLYLWQLSRRSTNLVITTWRCLPIRSETLSRPNEFEKCTCTYQ